MGGQPKTAMMTVSVTVIPKACTGTAWRPGSVQQWSALVTGERAVIEKECNILLSMRTAWDDGDTPDANLPNWSKDTSMSSWAGVTLHGGTTQYHRLRASSIILVDKGLKGGVGGQVGALSELTRLYIYGNPENSGTFPYEVAELTNLTKLHLGGNGLTGSATYLAFLGDLTNLTVLSLRDNSLSGDIMDEFAKLTKLKILDLKSNDFDGDLAKLKTLIELKILKLSNNDFDGTTGIPADLKALTKLRVLEIQSDGTDRISGSISSDLDDLVELRIIDLTGQNLTGDFGTIVAAMDDLQVLNLADNSLTGSIPASLGSSNLSRIDLSGNSLTGKIPPDLGNLNHLLFLYLDDNDLEGPLPVELTKLQLLPWGLRLQGNYAYASASSSRKSFAGFTVSAHVASVGALKTVPSNKTRVYSGDFESILRVTVTPDAQTLWASRHYPLKDGCDEYQPTLKDYDSKTGAFSVGECLLDYNANDFNLRIAWRMYDSEDGDSEGDGSLAVPYSDSAAGDDQSGKFFGNILRKYAEVKMPFADGAKSVSYDFRLDHSTGTRPTQKIRFYLWAGYDGLACSIRGENYSCGFKTGVTSEPDHSGDSGGILNGIIGAYTHDEYGDNTGGSSAQASWAYAELDLIAGQRDGNGSSNLVLSGAISPTLPSKKVPAQPPAEPSEVDFDGDTVVIQHVTSDSTGCLDVQWGNARDGQDVWTWECNETAAQTWTLERRTAGSYSGSYRAVSALGDYCLDNRGDFSTSERMGIWSCVADTHGAAANQSFAIAASGDGYTITFSNGTSEVWLVTDREDANARGGVNQAVVSGTAGSEAVWVILVE